MTDPLGLIRSQVPDPASRLVGQPGLAPDLDRGRGLPGAPEGGSFKGLLMEQLREANRLEQEATRAIEDLKTGKTEDYEAVFIAQRKAETAFQMLLQVRNKVMDAYNEVKQIRV